MNICFLYGKIISDVKFDFILNDKNNISVCYFQLKLLNESIINVKAYNEKADYCYGKVNSGDSIFLEGYLNNKKEVIINSIKKVT